jgi:hypothetical protein
MDEWKNVGTSEAHVVSVIEQHAILSLKAAMLLFLFF